MADTYRRNKVKDLFGQEITVDNAVKKRKNTQAHGYAAMPGTGPDGETCKTCDHSYKRDGNSKSYWKCDLVQATSGTGTDIRISWPACHRWAKKVN